MKDIDFEELDRAVDEMMRKNSKKYGKKPTDDLDSEEMAEVDGEMSVKIEHQEPVKDDSQPPRVELKNRELASKPGSKLEEAEEGAEKTIDEDAYKAKINSFLANYQSRRQETKPEPPKVEEEKQPVVAEVAEKEPIVSIVKSDEVSEPKVETEPEPQKDFEKPIVSLDKSEKPEIQEDVEEKVAVKVIKPKIAPVIRSTGKFMDFVNKSANLTTDAQEQVIPHSLQQVERAKLMVAKRRSASVARPMRPRIKLDTPAIPAEEDDSPKPTEPIPTPKNNPELVTSAKKLDHIVQSDDSETGELETQARQQSGEISQGVVNVDNISDDIQVFSPKIDLEKPTKPVVQSESKPSEDETALIRSRSPFIEQAKVKKRPLGNPELITSAPSVTMEVPERLTRLRADEPQTALYRSELYLADKSGKSSNWGWIVTLIVLLAALAFAVLYFFDDLKALFV